MPNDVSHSSDSAKYLYGDFSSSAKRPKMNNPDTQNNTFLFTSESVGEGHPGTLKQFLNSVYSIHCVSLNDEHVLGTVRRQFHITDLSVRLVTDVVSLMFL